MLRRWLFGSVLCFLALAGLAAWWIRREIHTPYYGSSIPETFVDIPRGASSDRVARLLEEAEILRYRVPFILYLRWTGIGHRLQAGEYRFASPAPPVQVAQRLAQGDVFFHSITIPEGLTARETITLISRRGLGDVGKMESSLHRTDWIRDLDPRAPDLEGYLFPETYRFSRNTTSEQIVRSMVDRFREVCNRLLLENPLLPGRNIRELVTMASLVEKEVKSDLERGLVASVLTNRINKKIPLACDPTIIYALKLAGLYDGNIRKADLAIDSPYNTYIHQGLPPGPVANPGINSLRAALDPPKSDFLYFVSRNDGTHEFSKDLQAHARAVARFQKGMGH